MKEIQIKVRFCETDLAGHINNTSYFIYLEEARTSFFEHLLENKEATKTNFILASIKCDFVNQGFYKQPLSVKTSVSTIGSKSFSLDHEVICSDTQQLIAKGNAVIVNFDYEQQKSVVLSEEMREILNGNLVYK